MSEVRSGVSRVSRRHPVPGLGPWIGFVQRRCGRGTFLTPCPRGCSMLLLVSLQWDSATGADRRWLQQEPEAGISAAFTGEATGRPAQLSLILCGISWR